MVQLYYHPGNASFAPHVLLEEIGAPYELVFIDRSINWHKSPEYKALNPSGRIPTLVDGDLVLFETGAICLHLADKHPEAELAPPPGSEARSELDKWLFYLATTIQTEYLLYFYPERHADDEAARAVIQRTAEAALGEAFTIVDEAVGAGPYMLGADYSLLDPYLLMLCRWGRGFARAPRDYPALGPYLQRVLARGAVQRTIKQEEIGGNFV